MSIRMCAAALAATWALGFPAAQAVSAPTDLTAAIASGTVNLDMRLRHERVDVDNPAFDAADALTARTRLGYTTAAWHALAAFAEFEYTSALVDDYAPATAGHATVADPEISELNQYGLRYDGVPSLNAVLGRSRLVLDNARWVGNVGWRQNEQTFDGAFLKYTGLPALTGQYAYLSNINTITATNVDVDAHLVNLAWTGLAQLKLTAYAYLLDYVTDTDTAATPDADTIGVRASGRIPLAASVALLYAAEYARQDAQVAASSFETDYRLAEFGLALAPATITLGWEVLGSDRGLYGLQTPLATKHAFQGWADLFLTTPAGGVEDLYAAVQGAVGRVKLVAAYHAFAADESTPSLDDYGREIDVSAAMALAGKLSGQLKWARYSADDLGADTDKLWLQLEYSL